MTGWKATSTTALCTLCSIERALLDTSFVYPFILVEGKAVSVIQLNYIALV